MMEHKESQHHHAVRDKPTAFVREHRQHEVRGALSHQSRLRKREIHFLRDRR
jgi:hypothetical protein